MNLIDRLVGYVDPAAGLRRATSRRLLARAYEGASPRDGWRPRRSGASANTDHRADGSSLRARSRSLVQNVPYVARGIASLVSNAVGTGIIPRSLASGRAGKRLNEAWRAWVKVADYDGRLDLYGMQAAADRAMEVDGEVIVRMRHRPASAQLVVPLQLQLLEIDWLDTWKSETNGANTIINGIEYDPSGRVAAYWLFDRHPGEIGMVPRMAGTTSKPVSARDILHLYNPERPGQGRGFPRVSPVIARVRDLQTYEDAELQRKNLETRLSVLASGDVSMMATPPAIGETANQDNARATGDLGQLSGGSIIEVPPGTQITVVEPKAAPGYVDYVKQQLHIIAAGMGVTYEMLTGDMKDTNFSSARVRLIDFRRECEQMQWLVLIPKLCDPIWHAFVDAANLVGVVNQAPYEVDWSTPKWDYVNPAEEVKADLAEISGGLSSISEKLRRRGYNPDDVFAELASDITKLRANGVLDFMYMLQKGSYSEAAPPSNDPPEE